MTTVLLLLVALSYLTGSAAIVYGIFLLTGIAGGMIAGGIALLLFGYVVAGSLNTSG